jgi:cytochrome c oxidase accessory protein FixG
MVNWHRLRKRVHLLCFLIFLALPFFNVVRFDIPRQRFYFFGNELWINEFGIVFFALMFLMFVVVIASVILGRVYCGYLCPQMIFSEAAMRLERRYRKNKPVFYLLLAAGSVFLAFTFMAYFVEPRDLARRLASLDIRTAGGISGAVVTILTLLDFGLLRLRFCTTVCPYGYLQGMLSDGNTLLVEYRDPGRGCIECGKCVRDCPMGIDIRKSPFQIECVHCGECIDSCNAILGRLKTPRPGLIHYSWGVDDKPRFPFDAKRVVLLLVLLFYAAGLYAALSMRHAVLVRINPDRATSLYRAGADGRVYNRFRYSLANRSRQPAAVVFSMDHLPSARLAMDPVPLKPGQSVEGEFEISMPAAPRRDMVTHFEIRASTVPEQVTDSFPMTFLSPPEAQ